MYSLYEFQVPTNKNIEYLCIYYFPFCQTVWILVACWRKGRFNEFILVLKPFCFSFQISKMESLHAKQTNVMRRKMEEAVLSTKRLKDVIEKQKANKKVGKDINDKSGLAGAAERMRNFVTQVCNSVLLVGFLNKSGFFKLILYFKSNEGFFLWLVSVRLLLFFEHVLLHKTNHMT